jgi:hypothetical protein
VSCPYSTIHPQTLADPLHDTVIIESQFFINAKVSQELLMEGFEMARARNDGKIPSLLLLRQVRYVEREEMC